MEYNCSHLFSSYISKEVYIVVGILLLTFFTYHVVKTKSSFYSYIGLAFVLAGGLHNMYERVVYNCVIDNFSLFGLSYFNLPDVSITVGLLIYVVNTFYAKNSDIN